LCQLVPCQRLKNKDQLFHCCYVVSRPLENKAAGIALHHWALKFQSEQALLTVEIFNAGTDKYGNENCVHISIHYLLNTRLNRRIFWYFWRPDNRNDNTQMELQHFTKRWEVLDFVNNIQVSCDEIAVILDEWYHMNTNKTYNLVRNNCQHFIRDMLCAIKPNKAHEIIACLDQSVIIGGIPMVVVSDTINEKAKIYELTKVMRLTIQKYNEYKDKKQAIFAQKISILEKKNQASLNPYELFFKMDEIIDDNNNQHNNIILNDDSKTQESAQGEYDYDNVDDEKENNVNNNINHNDHNNHNNHNDNNDNNDNNNHNNHNNDNNGHNGYNNKNNAANTDKNVHNNVKNTNNNSV